MPFGFQGAPSAFSMVENDVLRGLTWRSAVIYVDDKCRFATPSVEYIGHKDGIKVDSDKSCAVQKCPTPASVTELRSFIGLCNYYRRFIRDVAHIATPLNKLLQEYATFDCTDACHAAFEYLKGALTSEPVLLPFPDFSRELILYSAASNFFIGNILGQKDSEGRA